MEKETKKYCPLNNFQTICDNGCAWYNIQTAECSISTISKCSAFKTLKELKSLKMELDNINQKPI